MSQYKVPSANQLWSLKKYWAIFSGEYKQLQSSETKNIAEVSNLSSIYEDSKIETDIHFDNQSPSVSGKTMSEHSSYQGIPMQYSKEEIY